MNYETEQQSRERMNMMLYKNTLEKLTNNASGSKSERQDRRELNIKMKPNEIYAVLCSDNENYYRTVSIRKNDFTNGYSLNTSNPVYGIVPDGIQIVSQHAVFKQMRDMDGFRSLEAFPFRGRDGR